MLRRFLALVALLAIPASAGATPLNLDLRPAPAPDIMSAGISVEYVAASNQFTADGTAAALMFNGSFEVIMDGVFDLDATIDATGTATLGSLAISGVVDSNAIDLTGNLIDFGFEDAGPDPFQFLFETTGGTLSDDGTFGNLILVTLSMTAGYIVPPGTPAFSSSFSGSPFMAVSDTGIPVPEPSAPILAAFGGMVVALRLRPRCASRG